VHAIVTGDSPTLRELDQPGDADNIRTVAPAVAGARQPRNSLTAIRVHLRYLRLNFLPLPTLSARVIV
jgi:hypothetical protein